MYRILIYISSIIMAVIKIHEAWIASTDPVVSMIKILGIAIIIWYLFTPADLLQSKEDR